MSAFSENWTFTTPEERDKLEWAIKGFEAALGDLHKFGGSYGGSIYKASWGAYCLL